MCLSRTISGEDRWGPRCLRRVARPYRDAEMNTAYPDGGRHPNWRWQHRETCRRGIMRCRREWAYCIVVIGGGFGLMAHPRHDGHGRPISIADDQLHGPRWSGAGHPTHRQQGAQQHHRQRDMHTPVPHAAYRIPGSAGRFASENGMHRSDCNTGSQSACSPISSRHGLLSKAWWLIQSVAAGAFPRARMTRSRIAAVMEPGQTDNAQTDRKSDEWRRQHVQQYIPFCGGYREIPPAQSQPSRRNQIVQPVKCRSLRDMPGIETGKQRHGCQPGRKFPVKSANNCCI